MKAVLMQTEWNRVETKKPTNQLDVGFSVSYDCITGAQKRTRTSTPCGTRT